MTGPTHGLQVGLVPADLAASLRFYTEGLGLTPLARLPVSRTRALHRFVIGDATLKLLEQEGVPAPVPSSAPWDAAIGIRWLTFDVDDVAATVKCCLEAGGFLIAAPAEIRPGLWVAFVGDPDGNAVELVQRPDAP